MLLKNRKTVDLVFYVISVHIAPEQPMIGNNVRILDSISARYHSLGEFWRAKKLFAKIRQDSPRFAKIRLIPTAQFSPKFAKIRPVGIGLKRK